MNQSLTEKGRSKAASATATATATDQVLAKTLHYSWPERCPAAGPISTGICRPSYVCTCKIQESQYAFELILQQFVSSSVCWLARIASQEDDAAMRGLHFKPPSYAFESLARRFAPGYHFCNTAE